MLDVQITRFILRFPPSSITRNVSVSTYDHLNIIILWDRTLTMSTRTSTTIYAELRSFLIADARQNRSSLANKKRRQEQAADETTDAPMTTDRITNLIKDLWSDDKRVIQRALYKLANIGFKDDSPYENELKMRVLGVHTAVFQVLQKHVGCLKIQEKGMAALGSLSMLRQTQKLLGDIGCVEVILASMEKYPYSERVQDYGCFAIERLVEGLECNAECVMDPGGIAVVRAAMKAHPNCEELQDHGCCLLSTM
jgi:hypothetical protein